ncbi:MAG: Gfo/Idh/MocA family oxidoreductase, partial [Catalinimonas sp.]
MSEPITTGLVAYGMSGRVFHAPFLHTIPGFRLKTVVERHRNESQARYPDVAVVRSLNDLLADAEVELVVVTTPNHLHYDDARRALEAGKHVVVEKPFVENPTQAEALIALARRQERLLMVYQNRRWDGDFLTVQKVVEQEMLGDLLRYEAHFDRYAKEIRTGGRVWKEETAGATGALYDLGTHLIDQALVLFGVPRAVEADLRAERPGSRIHDAFDLVLDYGHGRPRVVLRASVLVREPAPRYTLHGTAGSFLKWGLDPQEARLKAGRWPDDPTLGVE